MQVPLIRLLYEGLCLVFGGLALCTLLQIFTFSAAAPVLVGLAGLLQGLMAVDFIQQRRHWHAILPALTAVLCFIIVLTRFGA